MLVSNWPFVAGCRLYLHWDHFEKYSSERGWSCVQGGYCIHMFLVNQVKPLELILGSC